MSYDLHVVRTKYWFDASNEPITKQEVDALIATDPELDWSASDCVDMKDEIGVVTRYFMINWKNSPCFWWYRDQIMCSNPDKAQQIKLARIARSLSASLIGDDGELYGIHKNFFGKEKIRVVDTDS